MNRSHILLTALCAVALTLTAAACDDGYEPAVESCNSNVACPIGAVCNRTVNACELEATNRVVGSLSCEFTPSAGDTVTFFGASDLSTWLGLQGGQRLVRVTPNLGAFCNYFNVGEGHFYAIGYDSTGTEYTLLLILPYPHAGSFEIVPGAEWLERTDEAGSLQIARTYPGQSPVAIADAAYGYAFLDIDAKPGTRPSVYIDVVMTPLE